MWCGYIYMWFHVSISLTSLLNKRNPLSFLSENWIFPFFPLNHYIYSLLSLTHYTISFSFTPSHILFAFYSFLPLRFPIFISIVWDCELSCEIGEKDLIFDSWGFSRWGWTVKFQAEKKMRRRNRRLVQRHFWMAVAVRKWSSVMAWLKNGTEGVVYSRRMKYLVKLVVEIADKYKMT